MHEAADHSDGTDEGAWGDAETVGQVEGLYGAQSQVWIAVVAEASEQQQQLCRPSWECC